MEDVVWTREGVVSLREIYSYIARDRPETAARTIDSVLNKVQSLAACPELGQHYAYRSDRAVHFLAYGHFRIAYLYEPDQPLVILGVFHGMIFLPLK